MTMLTDHGDRTRQHDLVSEWYEKIEPVPSRPDALVVGPAGVGGPSSLIVLERGATSERRAQVLAERALLGDAAVLEEALSLVVSRDLPEDERNLLVVSLEHINIPTTLRAAFASRIWAEALRLRGATASRTALWAALRQWSAVAAARDARGLAEFLRPEDVLTTRQVALQSVQSIFECATDLEAAASESLRDRVRVLLEKYLDADVVNATAEQTAFVVNALAASAALRDERLNDFVVLFRQRVPKSVLKQVKIKFDRIARSLSRVGSRGDRVMAAADALTQ